MPLKNDWVSGEQFNAADQDDVADAVNAVAAYPVDAYGADPTGTASSDTAFAAAITAMGTNPGVLKLGAGTYKLNSTKTLAYPGQGIEGQGAGVTTLYSLGTGDCLRVWDSTAPTDASNSPGAGGPISGFRIYGWDNTNTNTCGLHTGDLLYARVKDVKIDGFSTAGGKGFWVENRYTWYEGAAVDIYVERCTDNVVFETHASHPLSWSSGDFGEYRFRVIAAGSQNGVTLKNDIDLAGVDFRLLGNFYPADSNTGVALQIGTSGSDTSILSGEVVVDVETTNQTGSSPVGHKDINTPNSSWLALQAERLVFHNANGVFAAGSATRANVQVAGVIDCTSLGQSAAVISDVFQHKATAGVNLAYDPFFIDLGYTPEWYSVAGVLTLSHSTEQAKSGPRSLKAITAAATSGNNDGIFILTDNVGGANARNPASALKVQAGQKFYIELYARQKATNTNTAGNLLINAVVNDSTGVNAESYPVAVTVAQSSISNSGWTKVSGILTVPSGYDLMWPVAGLTGHTVASQAWYFDNLRLVDISETADGTITLTNKRITRRINTVASSATPAINVDTTDQFNITAQAAAITSMTSGLSGTPTDGQPLRIRFKDNGTARAITHGASFTGTLLTTTVANKTHVCDYVYDAAAAKWAGIRADTAGY